MPLSSVRPRATALLACLLLAACIDLGDTSTPSPTAPGRPPADTTPTPPPPPAFVRPRVVLLGNSHVTPSLAAGLLAALGGPDSATLVAHPHPTRTLADIEIEFGAAEIAGEYDAARPCVLVLVGSTNELWQGRGAADIARDDSGVVARARAVGYAVVLSEALPEGLTPATRDALNADYRALVPAPLAAAAAIDPRLGAWGSQDAHPELWASDRVHPSPAGDAVWAPGLATAVRAALR